MTDRITLHERAIVGLIMLEPSTMDRVEIPLAGHQWIDPTCRALWPILTEMRRRGEPIAHLPTLILSAKAVDVTAAEIASLASNDAGMVGQDAYHLEFLTETMERARLRRVAGEILRRVDEGSDSPSDIREAIQKQLYAVAQSTVGARNAGEIMREVIDRSKSNAPIVTVKTGLVDLDYCIGGFTPGQLVVLAARPSVGKSALAAQIAINAAKDLQPVLFVSLEMTSFETVSRALAMETSVEMRRILNGELASHEIDMAELVASDYQSIPLMIEDKRGLNIDRLSMLIRATSAHRKLGLVVIDYMGLIAGDRRKARWEYMTEISNALKTLAQAESIPILALCQLNRDSEGEVPMLSHLRDSGAIEQDADVVMLLHRESRTAPETELFVAKNRNGRIAKIDLKYCATRFEFSSAVGAYVNDFGGNE